MTLTDLIPTLLEGLSAPPPPQAATNRAALKAASFHLKFFICMLLFKIERPFFFNDYVRPAQPSW
jgi:hypothetical protein